MAPTADLVFDGECGFCTRMILLFRRLDRHRRVTPHASQQPGVRDRFGLTAKQAKATVWLFHDNRYWAGAEAINAAIDIALGTRLFRPIYRFPGCGSLQERVYDWIAANRGRLPGVMPWCTALPAKCDTEAAR